MNNSTAYHSVKPKRALPLAIAAGIKDLGDLSAYVPNFTKADTAVGQILSIRGIASGVNRGFEQSVVQYTDDVALTRGALARAPL